MYELQNTMVARLQLHKCLKIEMNLSEHSPHDYVVRRTYAISQ